MKKHLPSAIILFALLLVLCLQALAAENSAADPRSIPSAAAEAAASAPDLQELADPNYAEILTCTTTNHVLSTASTAPTAILNGRSIGTRAAKSTVNGTVFVAAVPVLEALFPTVTTVTEGACLTASGPGFALRALVGDPYFSMNGHYLYVPDTVLEQNGEILLPASLLAEALGCSLSWTEGTQMLMLKQVGPVVSAKSYPEEDLYWLSRAIYSESGNQPMAGRIAVGTVILNRVASQQFPNTIKEVIFAPGQFSPVANGTIYRTPDAESVIAAKLCLDGAREAGESLYFNVTSMYSWADQSRDYVCTIGGHNFYL